VLGAWDCGAFDNHPEEVAKSFKDDQLGDFTGCFREVVFTIVDWFQSKRLLGVFNDVFRE